MMHYKPLFSNPVETENTNIDAVWVALQDALAHTDYVSLNPETHEDNLDQEFLERLYSEATRWYNSSGVDTSLEEMESLLLEADIMISGVDEEMTPREPEDEYNFTEEEVEPSEEEMERYDTVATGLELVFAPLEVNNGMDHVLFEAASPRNGYQRAVTQEDIVNAVSRFNQIAFPDYQPEELIASLYLIMEGEIGILDEEERSMVVDSLREDAFCSDRNKGIILAAFGEEPARKFIEFCNKTPESRIQEWDEKGRSLHNIIGVAKDVFDSYSLAAFDSATSEELSTRGSQKLEDLVARVVDRTKDEPTSVIRKPRTPSAKTASRMDTITKVAILSASAVGAAFLVKKIYESR